MKEAPMPSCAAEAAIDPFAASHSVFDALALELGAEEAARLGHAELEDLLEGRGRELVRQLLQDHLDLRQIREERAVRARPTPVTGADGVTRRAVETGHRRLLASIFGTVVVGRCAWRAQGRVNVYPADAALRLPRGRHSHGLRRLAALEAVRGSFDQATEAIGRRCGPVVGKRGVEQLTVAAAADIDAFYRAVVPQPCSDATVLVLSVDGKGVVMRPEALREATVKAAQAKGANTYRTRLASGEKQGRKRMATLGVVYDATPAPRRAHDVICVPAATAEGRSGQRPRRGGPKAQAKWLTGSITQSSEQVIKAVFDQAEQRDPTHRRTWVVLVDGARHQLDLIRAEAVRRNVTVHILVDFIHVLEYLSAPRGALLYPPLSGEGLEGASLGLMAYLASKEKGDNSMPANQRPRPGVWGGALGDPRDMAKAKLPEPQLPEGAIRTPAGTTPATGAAPCTRFHRCLVQPSGARSDAQSGHSRK
jgi:hypothetical protein